MRAIEATKLKVRNATEGRGHKLSKYRPLHAAGGASPPNWYAECLRCKGGVVVTESFETRDGARRATVDHGIERQCPKQEVSSR